MQLYKLLKGLFSHLFSPSILKHNEQHFRRITYFFYKGNSAACNICGVGLRQFVKLDNGRELCPNCGSLPRTRRLYQVLLDRQLLKGRVLHFSPPKCLRLRFRKYPNIEYISSDYEKEFEATAQYDLTDIPLPDEHFDLLIVFHILEHIEQDVRAMSELFRVLKNGGVGLIQTPFKEGGIYEDPSIKTAADRLHHFGQRDHVRIYSIAGLKKRLESCGFQVTTLDFSESTNNYFGFKEQESILLVTK